MPELRVTGLGRTIRRDDGELGIVEDVDLLVPEGAAVAVTGPLDSGWRSLLRLVVGLDPATAGSVALGGKEVTPGSALGAREDRRQEVVFASALVPLVRRGLERAVRGVASLAASRRRRIGRPAPGALREAAAVTGAGAPSAAEELRLAVALAAALRPSHLVLEVEPALADAGARRALAAVLARVLGTGIGMLIGSRDEVLLAGVARSVTIMEDGAVLAEGPPQSVLPAAWRQARAEGLA